MQSKKTDVLIRGEGGVTPPCIGLTSNVISEAKTSNNDVCSNSGVSTKYAPVLTEVNHDDLHWYAVRTTYGREKKAFDYIIQHGGTAFLPTVFIEKLVEGKKKRVEVSRIPNIFFVYGTEETLKFFVYDKVNLPFLRFYYKHIHQESNIMKVPLVVPDNQINSLKIICDFKDGRDTHILQEQVTKFQKGEKVRVKEGEFEGVTGVVARYRGQQRVGLVIEGLLTAVTAYIPTAFLEKL